MKLVTGTFYIVAPKSDSHYYIIACMYVCLDTAQCIQEGFIIFNNKLDFDDHKTTLIQKAIYIQFLLYGVTKNIYIYGHMSQVLKGLYSNCMTCSLKNC